jgi:ADP-heptose:LPS heptosyltransferase
MPIDVSRINIHHPKIVDRARSQHEIKTICAVKLDHIGDFVTAMPAFQALRNEFPLAAIDLLCAPWNVAMARATGLFREINSIQCLAENPSQPAGPLQSTLPPELAQRPYDLAIDLRVQEESREILADINARWHAGVGRAGANTSNSIILPREPGKAADLAIGDQRFLSVEHATLPQPGSFIAQGTAIRLVSYEKHKNLIILGPLALPAGTYCASLLCAFFPKIVSRRPIAVLGAFVDGTLAVERRSRVTRNHPPCTIDFSVPRDGMTVDLRLRIRRGRFEKIDFHGALIHKTADRPAPAELGNARLRLHTAEQLLLLVNLVAGRLRGVSFPDRWLVAGADDRALSVAISPFSNSAIRDWPPEHYERLIAEIHGFYGGEFVLLGSAAQAAALQQLKIRLQAAGVHRVVVEAGMPMPEVIARLSRTSLVISNNSGIGHLAGALGRPVVAIYSAAHDVDEWGTVGSNVWLLQAEIGCKHCRLDFNEICANDRRCMRDLPPAAVLAVIKTSVVWAGNRLPAAGG